MATARKTDIPTPEPINLGLSGEDVQLPRLSVIGKLSKLPDHMDGVKSGNIAIGVDAEDTESQIIDAMNGAEKLRIYVLEIRPNYACSFKDKEANPDLAGQWEEGDPEMPTEAKRQYNYLLFIPQHSEILPVKYTASSSAAGEVKRTINSKLSLAAQKGQFPYEICFEMSTKLKTGGSFTWPGPVFSLVEANADEVVSAQQMYETFVGPARQQLAASADDSAKPAL